MDTEGTVMVQASDFSYYGHLTSHKKRLYKITNTSYNEWEKLKEILETV